jgi:diguanylate cyclase (GGDEF)-like protein
MAARLGGEEFCVLLYDSSPDAARDRFDDLLDRIRRLAIPHAGSPTGFLTLSAGATTHSGRERFNALVNRADAALYCAKHAGRDQLVWG